METYCRLIDGCDDAELRVLLSFYRIGGLRLGEAFEARWEDVDWRAERFTVRSPKTERSGKDRRLIPLFPELRRELKTLRSESRADDFIVVRRRDKQSVYNAIKNLCVALGIPVWARLVQNLRASRSNEIYREFNEVAESEWLGRAATTARRLTYICSTTILPRPCRSRKKVAKTVASPTGTYRNQSEPTGTRQEPQPFSRQQFKP